MVRIGAGMPVVGASCAAAAAVSFWIQSSVSRIAERSVAMTFGFASAKPRAPR